MKMTPNFFKESPFKRGFVSQLIETLESAFFNIRLSGELCKTLKKLSLFHRFITGIRKKFGFGGFTKTKLYCIVTG
jgi:hypothetical protein